MNGDSLMEKIGLKGMFFILLFVALMFCQSSVVFAQCPPTIVTTSLPNGTLGVLYEENIVVTGGYSYIYTWSVASGSLPPGLSLNSSTGLISGYPYFAGTFPFVIEVADSGCSVITATQSYSITIEDPCGAIAISPPKLPVAYVNQPYSVTLTATDGTPPYVFYACGDVMWPPFLNLSSDGVLSGTPTEEGAYYLEICVEDSCGGGPYHGVPEASFVGSGHIIYTLTVTRSCEIILISPDTIPDAVLGEPYSQKLTATGGNPPYSFSFTRGDLPPGLSLSGSGVLSGTPEEPGEFTFYLSAMDANGCRGDMVYSVNVNCLSGNGTLSGHVGIRDDDTGAFHLLNGSTVEGTVIASGAAGNVLTAELSNGGFSFGSVPAGSYSLSATVSYSDRILYDADQLSFGCAAPSQGRIVKTMNIPPRIAIVNCDTQNSADLTIPPPIVMLHGILDCYSKWYAMDPSDPDYYRHFDNYARNLGMISFTPNYDWWSGSWSLRASEVLDQIGQDVSSLCSGATPPYILVTHDMGGLVARTLGSGPNSGDPLVTKIKKVYLLGVPNSGADYNARLGRSSLLGPNSIIRYFNEVYPDFGSLDVHAVAGNRGWWETDNNDGVVSTGSLFNVRRITCLDDDCVYYPAVTLESGPGHVFNYNHWELGSPGSVEDIFGLLLDQGVMESGRPEAPVGGVGWGTVGHTSTVVTTNTGSLLARSEMSYPFTVSKCDGIAIVINQTQGSADFRFVDPSGAESLIQNGLFLKAAPVPGNCSLKVTPGPSGVSFSAVVVDNSIFGIEGYLTRQNLLPGESTIVRVDKKGDWSLVTPQSVQAFLYDSQGTLRHTVSLEEKSGFFSGSISAPETAGFYEVFIQATGTYNGAGFTRVEFETMNVLGASRLFTGTFSDAPADSDGNGKYDYIVFSCSAALPSAGYFAVTADLYDSKGNFVSHASQSVEAESQGTRSFDLPFSLDSAHCSQFAGKFVVSGLKMLDGEDLRPLDVWNAAIETRVYQQGSFDCSTAPLSPVISYLAPSKLTAGTTANIAVAGRNFEDGAELVLDPSITILRSERYDNRVLFASVNVSSSSPTGFHDVKIVNPDGRSGSLKGVLLIAADAPPTIFFESPSDGSVVSGKVDVTVNAADDIKVASVSFELDGVQKATVSSFPFIWSWDSAASGSGSHLITATAVDSSGMQTTAQSAVTVVQAPVIVSIAKKADPFRFVVSGSNFQPGASVYINGDPWTNIRWKNNGRLVIKGGAALKAKVPKGTPTAITIVNPDGGRQNMIWQW